MSAYWQFLLFSQILWSHFAFSQNNNLKNTHKCYLYSAEVEWHVKEQTFSINRKSLSEMQWKVDTRFLKDFPDRDAELFVVFKSKMDNFILSELIEIKPIVIDRLKLSYELPYHRESVSCL